MSVSTSRLPDYKALFEAAPEPCLALSPDFTIVAASDSYLKAINRERTSVLNRSILEVLEECSAWEGGYDAASLKESLERVLSRKAVDTIPVCKLRLRGLRAESVELRYWSPFSCPVLDDENRIRYIIHGIDDVTELTRAQEARAARDAATDELNRLKTQFFSNVGHELRTPLALILGPIQHRLRLPGLSTDEQRDLQIVERNARLLLKHVNDLLDLSKLEAGQLAARYANVDLSQLVRFIISHFEALASEREIVIALDLPPTADAQLDADKMQRVLVNLLSNAFKFTPRGGRIGVSLILAEHTARFEVIDSGPGVPSELRTAIFERFRQAESGMNRRHGGTGLGLTIAKEFVELHHGTIAAHDAPRGGAIFTVSVPRYAPPGREVLRAGGEPDSRAIRHAVAELQSARPADPPAEPPSDTLNLPLVLIIEDNPDMRVFLVELLKESYRVATAADGNDGLEKALALMPDLIITDLMMPLMSGDDMIAQLKQQPKLAEVPILVLTAKSDDALRLRLFRQGVQEYLSKPFSYREVTAKVERLITARRLAQEALRASNDRLELVLSHSRIGLWYSDIPLKNMTWSPTCREHLGASAEAHASIELFFELLHPDDREATRSALAKALSDGSDFELVYRTSAERWIRSVGRIYRDNTGLPIRLDGITTDITSEAKETSLKLRLANS